MYLHSFSTLLGSESPLVVPDSRAVRVMNTALDQHAQHRAQGSWQPATVLSWTNLLRREFERQALAGASDEAEFVLSRDQELALWESVIDADRELGMNAAEGAAPLALEAWHLQHLWCLPVAAAGQPTTADVAAFRRWAAAYRERTAALNVTDQARLLARAAARGPLAETLSVHGFIDLPPLLARWLGPPAERSQSTAAAATAAYSGHAFADREHELHAALEWAAAVASREPDARVVIALPSLRQDEVLVRRCCGEVFADLGGDAPARWFMSLPYSGALAPTLRLALLVLQLDGLPRWDLLSELVRHPLLAGAAEECAARALFDAGLRDLERYELPLAFVLERLADNGQCPRLLSVLGELTATLDTTPHRQRLAEWLLHFETCLDAAGWPGDGECEDARQGALRNWSEACDRLLGLDAVLAPVTRGEAVGRLRRVLNEAQATQRTTNDAIYVLEPDEALLVEPTHVWLAGCEADALPTRARLSPLLPLTDQRRAGMPGADPAHDLWRARVILDGLAGPAQQAHASYASGDGELRAAPSPLLPALAAAATAAATPWVAQTWRQALPVVDTIEDLCGPQLEAADDLRGGVGVLAAHSACPFRAFARYRLGATTLAEPLPGMSARYKGIVVHNVLAQVWQRLGTRAALAELDHQARAAVVREAINRALIPLPAETPVEREIWFVERARVFELVEHWLEFELRREAFSVIAVEQAQRVSYGALELGTRIDRIDRLDDGRVVIVDYKTGRAAAADWEAPRMAEPQLPLYALTAPYDGVAAVAFAHVDRANPRWTQRPRVETDDAEWVALATAWREDLDQLVAGISDGVAIPDPKHGAQTCRNCEQAPLCRILELASAPGDDDDSDTDTDHDD